MVVVGGGSSRPAALPVDLDKPSMLRETDNLRVKAPLLVVDPLGSQESTPGLLAHSVAEIARRACFDVSLVGGSGASLTLAELERTASNVVVLPICRAPVGTGSPADTLNLWEAPARLCRQLTKRGVLVISVMVGTPAVLLAACMAEGAIGVIGGDDLNQLLRRLRRQLAVQSNADSDSLQWLVDQPSMPRRLQALSTLTSSERRILCGMMQGWSASDIASSLVVALSTVRTHIRSILTKLGVSSQIAAVAIGYGLDPREGVETDASWTRIQTQPKSGSD